MIDRVKLKMNDLLRKYKSHATKQFNEKKVELEDKLIE